MTVQTYCFHEEKNTWCKVLGGGKEEHLLKINYFDVNEHIIFYLMRWCCRKYKFKAQE